MIEKLQHYMPFLQKDDTWILQIFAIVFVALLLDFIQKKILRRIKKQLEKTPNLWDDAFIHAVIKPLSVFIWVFGLSIALEIAGSNSSLKYLNLGLLLLWHGRLFD